MANAIIDTLKAKNASGEEVVVYPRTSFDAVKNDNGKTLTEMLSESSTGGFNDIYAETSMNLGRKADTTIGDYSVVGGVDNEASGIGSIAFGSSNIVKSKSSFVEGNNNTIGVSTSFPNNIGACHAEGNGNKIESGYYHHIEGERNTIKDIDGNGGYASHVEGYSNTVAGSYKHVEGYENIVTTDAWCVHVEGQRNKVLNGYGQIHVEGFYHELNADNIDCCHIEGKQNYLKENATAAHIEGRSNHGAGEASHTEGYSSYASYLAAHAEGYGTKSSAQGSHSEGYYTEANSSAAHAEGSNTKANGSYSHAEGYQTETASNGYAAHAEGYYCIAHGSAAHAEGYNTKATDAYSHAEGYYTEAGQYSHAEGCYTKATGNYNSPQHVQGKYNVEDTENKYAHIVGGGTSDSIRKNIHTLDWEGNAVFGGMVTDGNGATISGIESTVENITNSPIESPIAINSIAGVKEQVATTGMQFYDFKDIEITQNGITFKFEGGIGTLTGAMTGTMTNIGGDKLAYDLYFDPIDNSKLIDGVRYYANECSRGMCAFKICDENGNVVDISTGFNECQPAFTYDSSTMANYTFTPHIYASSYSYQSGMTSKPLITVGKTSSPKDWEIYTGGIPSPNPMYPQTPYFPSFTSVIVTGETDSCLATLPKEISLYSINDVADVVNKTQYIKRLELITLVGNEEFVLDSATNCFICSLAVPAKSGINIISDHYKYFETMSETNYSIFITEDGNIAIRHDGFTTVDDYKTWLISNNVVVVYERAIEEVTTLDANFVTELANLKLFVGENTVSTDSTSIQPIIDFDYATSKMGKYVMELLTKVAALETINAELTSIINEESF